MPDERGAISEVRKYLFFVAVHEKEKAKGECLGIMVSIPREIPSTRWVTHTPRTPTVISLLTWLPAPQRHHRSLHTSTTDNSINMSRHSDTRRPLGGKHQTEDGKTFRLMIAFSKLSFFGEDGHSVVHVASLHFHLLVFSADKGSKPPASLSSTTKKSSNIDDNDKCLTYHWAPQQKQNC